MNARTKAVEAKPAWLRRFTPAGNTAKLTTVVCPGCGRYVISQRLGVWESWDAGVISGDDLTVAVILNRRLTRIAWLPGLDQPRLIDVCGTRGLDPTATYLAAHDCGQARISGTPYRPPRRAPHAREPFGKDLEPTRQETEEFMRLWRMPLTRLRRELERRPRPLA